MTTARTTASVMAVRGRILCRYWMALPMLENTLLAFDPIIRTVPRAMTKITASITAYSAMSCPSSAAHNC